MAAKTVLLGVCEHKKSGEIYDISPDVINVVDGWNPRRDFSGEDELVTSLKNGEKIPPLFVRKIDGRLDLVDGERRLRAVKRARMEGAEIKVVPVFVMPKGASDVNLYFAAINANGSKPFTPTEEAAAFKRLLSWGVEVKEIANRTGKSITHIRNRIQLAEASPEVKAAADAGEITTGDAQAIAKQSGGDIERQRQALNEKKSRPKTRKLVLSFKKGILNQTGFKGGTCEPLKQVLRDSNFLDSIKAAGFDPTSLKITLQPISSCQDQKPLWEQEPDEKRLNRDE